MDDHGKDYNLYESYSYPASDFEPQPVRKIRRVRRGAGAGIIALSVILSSGFGFAGGYLSSGWNQPETPLVTESAGANVVMYEVSDAEMRQLSSLADEDGALNASQIAELVGGSVVEITTESLTTGGWIVDYVQEGAGSGVIVSTDGYIVTNNHVIDGASSISVNLSDGETYPAELIGKDAETDLAVIKIDATGLTPAVFGDSSALAVGDMSLAVGNPLGAGGTVTGGMISALDREITIDGQNMSLLQTDTAINPGNSGGGLFNDMGELIGVVNAKSSGTDIEGIGFAIPINTAKPIIEDLIEFGYVRGRIDHGLTLIDVRSAAMAMRYRVSRTGLYVYEANIGDFKNGDIITKVDDTAIETQEDFNLVMENYSVGDTVQMTVLRGSELFTLPLTLGESK